MAGGIFGSTDGGYVMRIMEASENGFADAERDALREYFVDRARRTWFSREIFGLTMSHRMQSRIAATYDVTDALRALASACWHLRHDTDRLSLVLRATKAFALWRDEEERASPDAMPPWMRGPFGPFAGVGPFNDEDFGFRKPKAAKPKRSRKKKKVPDGR